MGFGLRGIGACCYNVRCYERLYAHFEPAAATVYMEENVRVLAY